MIKAHNPQLRQPYLALLVIILAVIPRLLFAQADSATVSGRVADPDGLAIQAAMVRVINADTAFELAAESNGDGVYVIRNVRPGLYRVMVEKTGFKAIVLDGLAIAVQDTLGRNFTMELGPVADSVTVRPGREVNLSAAVSTVVDRQFVENMPLNGRSFQSLIQLTPGVLVTPAGQGMEGQFSTSGQRTNANYFTVDGVSVNFGTNMSVNLRQSFGGTLPALTTGGGTNSLVSVDAMREFRTQTSTYSAEFGRASGAQIAIVTRSGTNRFHGTAFDYVRNSVFDARNWFDPAPEPKPPLSQQNFGGTLGGPLRRNQSFFFVSYEGLRLRQARNATGTFYNEATRAAVAAVYQPIINALPIPSGNVIDASCDNTGRPCRAELAATVDDPTRFDATSVRLDHAFGPRVTAFVRGSLAPSSTIGESGFSSQETASVDAGLVTAGVTAVLGSGMVNDVRVGWARSTGGVEITRNDRFGAVAPPVSALFATGTEPGSNQRGVALPDGTQVLGGTRAANASEQFNLVDTFSILAGRHQLKFGVDYRRFQSTNGGSNTAVLQLTNFQQLRDGTMGAVSKSVIEGLSVRMHNTALFAQDTWQATSRLTLTYGLRWDINTAPVSITPGKPLYAVDGIFAAGPVQLAAPGTPLWRTRFNEFAPRLGVAFQLSPATIVRAGGGLFHDLGYAGLLGDLMASFPYRRQAQVPVAGQPFDLNHPAFAPLPITPSLDKFTSGNIAAFDPNLRLPATTQWNASVEHSLGANQTLSLTYVAARGRDLLRPDYIVLPGSGPAVSRWVSVTRNAGDSRYSALQLQFHRRMNKGLQALASYTLASARDRESDDQGGNFFGASWNANYATSVSAIHVPPLAPADFDIRHAASAAISYDLPAPALGTVGRAVLSNWGVDAIVRINSAPPLNVRIEGVSPEYGPYRSQPDLVPGQPLWLAAPDAPGGQVLNAGAFTLPPWGVAGNFPRNSIRSLFGLNQTDLSLRRRFPIAGGTSLEFRAEFFNLFNRPMFESPLAIWGRCGSTPCTGKQAARFGRANETLNLGLGGGGLNGGQSAIYAPGGSRSIQFSLKLRF